MKKKRRFRFAELFARLGGFRVALESLGGRCVFSAEQEQLVSDIYHENFGREPVQAIDITQVKSDDIPEHDVLCGGFPCTDFTISGQRKGISGPMGQLVYEVIRIARDRQPRFLLLENVPGLVGLNKGQYLEEILGGFDDAGYHMNWKILNSAEFGFVQARKRVYFIGTRKDLGWGNGSIKMPKAKDRDESRLRDIVEDWDDAPDYTHVNRPWSPIKMMIERRKFTPDRVGWFPSKWLIEPLIKEGLCLRDSETGQWLSGGPDEILRINDYRKIYYELWPKYRDGLRARHKIFPNSSENLHHWDAPMTTKLTGGHQRFRDDQGRVRELSIVEAKRLQGFPDDFVVGDNHAKAHQIIGQAVIPAMLARVARRIPF